jgi:predicted N-acetyltransferase YhbS
MPLRIRTLERSDVRTGFACGDPSLDGFIERYAWQNQQRHHLGVTYVAVDDATRRVVGYFTAAMASVAPSEAGERVAHGGYAYVPALRIARLAVDRRFQGVGIGCELLYAALQLALAESKRVGCAGVLVDSLPDSASFYGRFGFTRLGVSVGASPVRPRPVPLYLGLGEVRRAGEST